MLMLRFLGRFKVVFKGSGLARKPGSSGLVLEITDDSVKVCVSPDRSAHVTTTLTARMASAIVPLSAGVLVNVALVPLDTDSTAVGSASQLMVPPVMASNERMRSMRSSAIRVASVRCLDTSALRDKVICMPDRASIPNAMTSSAISASISVNPA